MAGLADHADNASGRALNLSWSLRSSEWHLHHVGRRGTADENWRNRGEGLGNVLGRQGFQPTGFGV